MTLILRTLVDSCLGWGVVTPACSHSTICLFSHDPHTPCFFPGTKQINLISHTGILIKQLFLSFSYIIFSSSFPFLPLLCFIAFEATATCHCHSYGLYGVGRWARLPPCLLHLIRLVTAAWIVNNTQQISWRPRKEGGYATTNTQQSTSPEENGKHTTPK